MLSYLEAWIDYLVILFSLTKLYMYIKKIGC